MIKEASNLNFGLVKQRRGRVLIKDPDGYKKIGTFEYTDEVFKLPGLLERFK